MNERGLRALTLAAFPAQAVLLAVAAARNVETVNPDAVAYLRLAGHWADGRSDLAVTGYWGPLLPWVLAPLVGAGLDPLVAARIAMAVSAVVFLAGTRALLAALGLAPRSVAAGTWVAAAASVAWSVEATTPDLLLAGFHGLGTAAALRAFDAPGLRPRLVAGAWFGLGYLAKGIGLPSAVLTVGVLALLSSRTGLLPGREAVRRGAAILAAALVVALPWIATLSVHYGRPTFSTTGPLAHAVVGPSDVERWYPTFVTFHTPEAGRVTSWEEPTVLPPPMWMPWDGAAELLHQFRVVGNNLVRIAGYLAGFDLLGIGLASAVLAFVLVRERRETLARERWRWALPLVAAATILYLPVFATSERYYWAAWPLFAAAAFGLANDLLPAPVGRLRFADAFVAGMFLSALVSFDVPGLRDSVEPRPSLVRALRGRTDGRCAAARALASGLRAAGIGGPVAGDVRESLYVAWFLGVPWHGQEEAPSADRCAASGAATFVVRARGRAADVLDADPRFLRADVVAHGSPAAQFAVYRLASVLTNTR